MKVCFDRRLVTQATRSDYARALNMGTTTANKVFKQRVNPHRFRANTQFWYRNNLADGAREFVLVNAETGVRGPALDHKRLAAALSKPNGEDVHAERLPIDKLKFGESGREFLYFSYSYRDD